MLSRKKFTLLILPFLFFAGSLTAQLILFFNTTSRIEQVSFPSTLDENGPVVEITSGNLFYPRNYVPGEKYPVVIIVHGFEVTKTTDLRLATELTKRGIFALPIDLSGHGHTTGILGPYFWKHAIGALDYVYSRPDFFNLSAVGMCGHSLGGWTTLLAAGYEASRLDRLNACVSWAGVFNTSRMLDALESNEVDFTYILRNLKVDMDLFNNLSYQFDHNPVSYFNGSLGAQLAPDVYGPRILLIHGTADDVVPYANLLDANKTLGTNATYYTLEGVDHLLIDDRVVYQTILHFEYHFFGIDPSENTLSISNFTYLSYYILQLLTLLGLFLSILSLIFIFWYKEIVPREETLPAKPRGFKFIALTTLPYVGIIFAIYGIQLIVCNLFFSLLIGSLIFFAYSLGILIYLNRNSIERKAIWNAIRSNSHASSILVGFHLGLFAILGYLTLAYGFGLFVFSPLSIQYLVFSVIGLLPFILSHEIFLRKIIQDNIPLRNRWLNRIFMGFYTLFLMAFFVYQLNIMFLAVVAMLIGFAFATLTGIFLYAKYPSLGATAVFITVITSTFAANCYFFFI